MIQEKLPFTYLVSHTEKFKSMSSTQFSPFDIFLVVSNMQQFNFVLNLEGL